LVNSPYYRSFIGSIAVQKKEFSYFFQYYKIILFRSQKTTIEFKNGLILEIRQILFL